MSLERAKIDVSVGFVLLCVAIVVLRALVSTLGVGDLVFGSDTALWGLTAKNLSIGLPSILPPVFPWLVALAGHWTGDLVVAGLRVSGTSWMLLMPAMWLLARRFGASVESALVAALATLVLPELVFFGMQLQPDGLATLVLLGGGPVAAWYWQNPSLRRAAGLGAWGALTWLVREHGSVLLAIYGLLALAAPGSLKLRAQRMAILVALVALAPLAALAHPSLPWDAPWMARVRMATQGSENIPVPQGGSPDMLAAIEAHKAAHARNDTFAVMRIHAMNNLFECRDEWTFILLAALAAPLVPFRRLILGLPVLTALPTLPILAQRRHVLVVVPCALLVLGALLDREPGWRDSLPARIARGAILLAAAVLVGHSALQAWGGVGPVYRSRAAVADSERSFAMNLCSLARPGDLVDMEGGPRGFIVYCPLPTGAIQMGEQRAADWRIWYVGQAAPADGWTAMGPSLTYPQEGVTLGIYRLAPWLSSGQRPCEDSAPPRNTPYLSLERAPVELSPACSW